MVLNSSTRWPRRNPGTSGGSVFSCASNTLLILPMTVSRKLVAGKESAYLSYDLATIRCSAPIDFTPEANRVQQPDKPALRELFRKLEFVRLMDRYGLNEPDPLPAAEEAPRCGTLSALPSGKEPFALILAGDTVAVATDKGAPLR